MKLFLLLNIIIHSILSQTEFYKSVQVETCNSSRKRNSIYNLSQEEWTAYANAIKELNSGSRPTKWDELSKLHNDIYATIHSKASFFAWHRAFLFIMEKELQKIDSSIMIPYWDWTHYSQNPENDPVFNNHRFGGNGDKSNGEQIKDGSFYDFKVSTNGQEHNLRRSFNEQNKKLTSWLAPETIDGMILNSNDFNTFWNRVEAGPHGLIHNGIGSDFSGHASPADPIFFSHHAFVDKMWYDWVQRDPTNRMQQYATDDTVPNLDAKLNSFNITTRQVLDIENSLCYTYPEDHFSWSKNSKLGKRDYSVNQDLFNKAYEMTKILPHEAYTEVECDETADLRQYNLDYVMKGINAPPTFDRTNQYKLKVPVPQREEFLLRLGYDVTMVRQLEKQFAKFISTLNDDKSYISDAALVNQKSFPKLKTKSKCKNKFY